MPGSGRQSPRTVETSVVVVLTGGWSCGARLGVGQAGACPRLLPEGSQRLGGPGRAEGASRVARCQAPWRPEGRPRILRGLHTRPAAAQPSPLSFGPCPAGRLVVTRPVGGGGRARSRTGSASRQR